MQHHMFKWKTHDWLKTTQFWITHIASDNILFIITTDLHRRCVICFWALAIQDLLLAEFEKILFLNLRAGLKMKNFHLWQFYINAGFEGQTWK